MKNLMVALFLITFISKVEASVKLLPQFLASPRSNQITMKIPLGFEMKEAPSLSFNLSFTKGRNTYLNFKDAFLSDDKKHLIVSGFLNSKAQKGNYKLSGIFYQSNRASGEMIQGNCQVWYFNPFALSCYDNGVLLPYTYSLLSYKLDQTPTPAPRIQDRAYSELKLKAQVFEMEDGSQKVKVSITSYPRIFEYFIGHVVFEKKTGDRFVQSAYFSPQYLSQINQATNTVEIQHLYDAATWTGAQTPSLKGSRIKQLAGRNQYGEKVQINCDPKTSKLTIQFHEGELGSTSSVIDLGIDCPIVTGTF